MKIKNWISVFIIVGIYLLMLFLYKREIFSFRFNNSLIDRYFLSQDIPHEVKGKRLFLSDAEIYTATGYLYAKGEDPSLLNFDHPPLIKYLFGYAILYFKNPYIVQMLFGCLLLLSLYFLGLKVFASSLIASLACIFLILDPVFLDSSSQLLLDTGETAIMLLYFISSVFLPNDFLFSGILLGLFAGTKSMVTPLFFMTVIQLYKILKKEFDFKKFILHLAFAALVFCLIYSKTFFLREGKFNIVFFVLKVVKFRLQHNITAFPGASLILFLTGYFRTWWEPGEILRTNIWSFFWPLTFLTSFLSSKHIFGKKKFNLRLMIAVIPLAYLFFLGIQAPFSRYFLVFLPFSYLTFAEYLVSKFGLTKTEKHNINE